MLVLQRLECMPNVIDAESSSDRHSQAADKNILVYELYGHYSFDAVDGSDAVTLAVEDGYTVEPFLRGVKVIVGRTIAFSIEQAIYHGLAYVVR